MVATIGQNQKKNTSRSKLKATIFRVYIPIGIEHAHARTHARSSTHTLARTRMRAHMHANTHTYREKAVQEPKCVNQLHYLSERAGKKRKGGRWR